MNIEEWNKTFSREYIQEPISFLTEENLDKLQQHCEKTIKYATRRVLEEHQITLELIIRYRELQQEFEKEKEKNKKIDEFCRKELAFERRLQRENRKPDEFNQGRFYVSENIRKIIEEE